MIYLQNLQILYVFYFNINNTILLIIVISYYSQYNQDEFLDKIIFKGYKNGFYVDVGAHDDIYIKIIL